MNAIDNESICTTTNNYKHMVICNHLAVVCVGCNKNISALELCLKTIKHLVCCFRAKNAY